MDNPVGVSIPEDNRERHHDPAFHDIGLHGNGFANERDGAGREPIQLRDGLRTVTVADVDV